MKPETNILFHLDDVGVSRGSVEAWKALRSNGVVQSASVMVPCPWYPTARDDWQEEPGQDLGIHITLTSEWSAYRWRPMIGPVKGLCDDDGFFHKRPEAVAANADPNAVGDEISAQIERMLADGLKPTHMDAHMGTAYLEPFIRAFLDASDRYGIPILFCHDFSKLFDVVRLGALDLGYLAETTQQMARRDVPILDKFLIGYCPDDMMVEAHYAQMIAEAGPGTHWLAIHANAPDDMAAYAPHMALPRQKEYEFFSASHNRGLCGRLGIRGVNWLDIAGPG